MEGLKPKRQLKPLLILGAGLGLFLFGVIVLAALTPQWLVRWLGGDEFRKLASEQVSNILGTQGEFTPLRWSSFSVYSESFTSQKNAPGPWIWNLGGLRAEISPRLLLDRILRFPEISIESVTLFSGSANTPTFPEKCKDRSSSGTGFSKSSLLKGVEVGKLVLQSFTLQPSQQTQGWGISNALVSITPQNQRIDFLVQKGQIAHPFPCLGSISLEQAKGRFLTPVVYLTELSLLSSTGGRVTITGDVSLDKPPIGHAQFSWEHWEIPGKLVGLGMYVIHSQCSGEFQLVKWKGNFIQGQGTVNLQNARIEPVPGVDSMLGFLAIITGEPALRGCALTKASADFVVQGQDITIKNLDIEASGLLRVRGEIRIFDKSLDGNLTLGLRRNLGAIISTASGGELFRIEEDGFLCEPVHLTGTLENPNNDLDAKLKAGAIRGLVRTGAQLLEKAAGVNGQGSGQDAAGQVLKGIRSFLAPPNP